MGKVLDEAEMGTAFRVFVQSHDTLGAAAEALGVTRQYIAWILKGEAISERIAQGLGYEKRIVYVPRTKREGRQGAEDESV